MVEVRTRTLTAGGTLTSGSQLSLREARGDFLLSLWGGATNNDSVFEPPLRTMPADPRAEPSWESRGKLGMADYHYTARLLGETTVETGLGRFEDCLELEARMVLSRDGTVLLDNPGVYAYCAGAGPVRWHLLGPSGEVRERTAVVASSRLPGRALDPPPPLRPTGEVELAGEPADWKLSRLGRARFDLQARPDGGRRGFVDRRQQLRRAATRAGRPDRPGPTAAGLGDQPAGLALYLGAIGTRGVWLWLTAPGRPLSALQWEGSYVVMHWWTLTFVLFGLAWLVRRQLTAERAGQLIFLLLIVALLEQTDFISNPFSPFFSFAGIGFIAFGIVWDAITIGAWANRETPGLPRASRIFLYLGYVLLTVTLINWVLQSHDLKEQSRLTGEIALNGMHLFGKPMLYAIFAATLMLTARTQAGTATGDEDRRRGKLKAHFDRWRDRRATVKGASRIASTL